MVRFGQLVLRSPDRGDSKNASKLPFVRDYSGNLHTVSKRTDILIQLTFSFLPDSQVEALMQHYAECIAPFDYTDYRDIDESSSSSTSNSASRTYKVIYNEPLNIIWDRLRGGASVSLTLRRV